MSVHRRVSKSGKVSFQVKWREGGHQPSRSFRLRKDAVAWDRDMARRRQLGPLAVQQLTATSPTLNEWIELHWAPEHAVTLAQSTRHRYANVYAVHIEPTLGSTPLSELTVRTLRAWQARLLAAGVQPGTIHKARTFLSSVLRHAAESEAIPANPLTLVRAPRNGQRDAVRPLAPATVEAVRRALLDPQPHEIAASGSGQRSRRRYELAAPGTPQTRRRDALIVSVLAYSGLRPGELRALRWQDVGETVINVQRAADDDGRVKVTKTGQRRNVRLLAPLAAEIREYRLATGRPPAAGLLLPGDDGRAWTKAQWQVWRRDRWQPACQAAGLTPAPRPYLLRHSFASLLLAEGRQPRWIADQLGHTLAVLLSTYSHLIAEFEDRPNIDAEREILAARGIERAPGVHGRAPGGRH